MRKPSILLPVIRVFLISALLALMCFAIALFAGIVGVGVANLIRGGGLSLSLAYRHIAFPVGMIALGISLIMMGVAEMREFRHQRARYESWRRAA
jgi:hypothetical protein